MNGRGRLYAQDNEPTDVIHFKSGMPGPPQMETMERVSRVYALVVSKLNVKLLMRIDFYIAGARLTAIVHDQWHFPTLIRCVFDDLYTGLGEHDDRRLSLLRW